MWNSIITRSGLDIHVKSLGEADGKTGRDLSKIKPIIAAFASQLICETLAERKGVLSRLRYDLLTMKNLIRAQVCQLQSLERKALDSPPQGLVKSVLFYILPALLYIMGDITFSKELIIQGWGLGRSGPLETWSLAVAVGLAPFVVKHVIRYAGRWFGANSRRRRLFLISVHLALGVMMVLAFLQVGYLRGIIFKFTKISITGNAYDFLFEEYPHVMIMSFVVVAFMFVVGGGLLLNAGVNDISLWFRWKSWRKKKQSLISLLQRLQEKEGNLLEEITRLEAITLSRDQIEEEKSDVANQLFFHYRIGYAVGVTKVQEEESLKKIKEREERRDNFHGYIRQILDGMAQNGRSAKEVSEYV